MNTEANPYGMALFFFGVHLFGHDGQGNGEALSSGDGETLLVVVRAEEHVVADGIQHVVVVAQDSNVYQVVAADGSIMDKLCFTTSIRQTSSG